MRKRPLFLLACVFLTGLAYQRYQVKLLIGIPIVCVCVEIYRGMQNKSFKIIAGRSLVLLSAFILGMTHMQKEELFRNAYMSKIVDGGNAIIWGEIKKIETTNTSVRTILTDCYIRLNEEILPCNDVMVYTSSNHYQVGDIYQITGQLHTFERPRNLGGFDSMTFYQSQKIDFYLYEKESKLLEHQKNPLTKDLLVLKESMQQIYEKCLEEKAAGFFSAMILGEKTDLEEPLKELFELGGISHILAISGLHVSIIGRGFYKRLRKRKLSFLVAGILASILLLAYGYMVGNGMSAVRAIGMMLCYFLAQYWGRGYDMLNALGCMCLFLLWENPFLIEYSGFGFSVMAMIGVGYVGIVFSENVSRGKAFWSCVGITLSTLPVVACCYYEIPLYSSMVNMIVLPILTPLFCVALLTGFLSACVSLLVHAISLPCEWVFVIARVLLTPCAWVLEFYEWLCGVVEMLPGASVITGTMSMPQVVGYYSVLFLAVYLLKRDIQGSGEKNRVWIWKTLLCVFCFGIVLFPKDKPFEITFLDVGQGDGIYISDGSGNSCFIDGGSADVDKLGEYHILPFLKCKGVRKIDYWFVSHADTDHISGLLEVLESGYEVKYLVLAAEAPRDDNLSVLIKNANDNKTKVIYMKAGDMIQSENMTISCLYPWSITTQDRNDSSMVLCLDAEMTALFAGDISEEVEKILLDAGVLEQIDVFKGIHHGSKYSNSEQLLETISPKIAVISCGMDNPYGHPHVEVIEKLETVGCEIYCTMEMGQVTIFSEEKHR